MIYVCIVLMTNKDMHAQAYLPILCVLSTSLLLLIKCFTINSIYINELASNLLLNSKSNELLSHFQQQKYSRNNNSIRMHMLVYLYTYMNWHEWTKQHVYMYMYIHIDKHSLTHVHTHTHPRTHTHTTNHPFVPFSRRIVVCQAARIYCHTATQAILTLNCHLQYKVNIIKHQTIIKIASKLSQ
jgi:tRNA nucleotidyltransferase (CCA-adding enzyme)